ncbi:MAG: ankyrin repeat domain-containing protein [Mycobacterium sp.]|nr:ankyrin repeat domain-containing protein [Mycobacterium sp.]
MTIDRTVSKDLLRDRFDWMGDMTETWSAYGAYGEATITAAQLKQQLDGGSLDIDEVNDDGKTPLHQAIDLGAEDLAVSLVDAGADVNVRDRWGNTPLWRAVYHAPGTEDLINVLLEHGADPAAQNNHGVSAIDLAAKMTDDEATADLLPTLQGAAGAGEES